MHVSLGLCQLRIDCANMQSVNALWDQLQLTMLFLTMLCCAVLCVILTQTWWCQCPARPMLPCGQLCSVLWAAPQQCWSCCWGRGHSPVPRASSLWWTGACAAAAVEALTDPEHLDAAHILSTGRADKLPCVDQLPALTQSCSPVA